jgi:ATP-binding cassette subfamily C protein CydCD
MNFEPRLLSQARRQPILFLTAILSGLGVGLLIIVQAWLVSRAVGKVFLEGDNLSQITGIMAGILLLLGLRTGLAWLSGFSARKASLRLVSELRLRLFNHLFELGPVALRGEKTGELVNTLTAGMDALETYFSQYLPQVALAALLPLTFLVFIFPLDPLSGLILLLTAPLIPLFMILIGKQAERLTRRQWGILSRMSAFFLDILQGLETLKILGRSQAQTASIAQVNDRYRLVTLKVMRVTFLSALALELLATLSTAVVAVEVGLRLLYGRLDFEQAFFVLLLAPEFYLPLRSLGARFHAGMAGVTAAGRVFELLENRKDEGGRMIDDFHPSSFCLHPSLSFRNISFSYGEGRDALRGVSFDIPAGKRVALVGPSGSGKSTLADLVLRFSQPQAGEILVDGKPLQDIPAEGWRAQVAWVPQSPYLFYGTLEDNIRLGEPQAGPDLVMQAARQAHALEFIQALPQGFQTMIGERGARLSGGQAQRIALARVFLKDAPLVILDEAAASLDPEMDSLLQESIDSLLVGRTAVLIAHRLGTALRSDHVVVLSDGQVIEQGSPQELLKKDGVFAKMVSPHPARALLGPPLPLGGEGEATYPSHLPAGGEGEAPHPSPLPLGGEGEAPHPNPLPSRGEGEVFLRLLTLLKPFTGLVALSVLLGSLTVLSGVGLLATSAYLISFAALAPSIAELQVAVVGVRFFGITRGLFRYLERLVTHDVTLRLLGALRVQFYSRLEPLAPARLQQYRSGDLLRRIIADIDHLEGFYVRAVAPGLEACLVGLVVGWFFKRHSLDLTLGLWLMMAVGGIGLPFLMRLAGRQTGREQIQLKSALHSSLVDSLQGMPDLLAFRVEPRQKELIARQSISLEEVQLRLGSLDAWQGALSSLVAQLGLWLVLILAIPLVTAGEISGLLLASLALAAAASFEAVAPLPLAAQVLESDLEAGRRLFEILDARPEMPDPPDPLPMPVSLDVEVRSLSFVYPSAGHPPAGQPGRPGPGPFPEQPMASARILNDISFSLPIGKKLAVVGASGCGKTTLASLLLGFWQPTQGQICLAGVDLGQYSFQDWRSQVAVIRQNPHLFNASLRENLLLARPAAASQEIETVLEQAQLLDWVKTLPQGIDTPLGELGVQISGGERQRVAIARALLKDAPLLILDEPTANLDVHTERRVLDAILHSVEGRSLLLITHRLICLEAVDEILVLSAGRVVERGTQTELLSQKGHFYRMWQIQQNVIPTILQSLTDLQRP